MTSIKKVYNQFFESKDKKWRLKHDYKNLKDVGYQRQPNKPQQLDDPDQPDQEFSPLIQQKGKFNELKDYILIVKDNELKNDTSKY